MLHALEDDNDESAVVVASPSCFGTSCGDSIETRFLRRFTEHVGVVTSLLETRAAAATLFPGDGNASSLLIDPVNDDDDDDMMPMTVMKTRRIRNSNLHDDGAPNVGASFNIPKKSRMVSKNIYVSMEIWLL